MDWIMEENIKSFSKWFVDNQSRIAELEEANKKLHEICDKYVPMALRLEDENKRLNEDFDNYKKKVSEDMKEIVKEQTENIKLFDTIKGEYKKLLEENRELRKLRAEDFEITWLKIENSDLREENKRLEEENEWFNKKIKEAGKYVGATMKENRQLEKENKKLRKNYYNLSKIVETTGGYKASYVNELRDKIAKLEFDIETLKKWEILINTKEENVYWRS